MVVERTGDELHQRSLGMRNTLEQRSEFRYKPGGISTNSFRDEPMKSEARLDGNFLEILSRAKTPQGEFVGHETWKISSDGSTLIVQQHNEFQGRTNEFSSVYERAPASAGEVLNRPEQKAGAGYKNVLILKDVPVSNFIPIMRRFSAALGVECEHCHVATDYSSDEKGPKATARKMMTMAGAINKEHFGGQNAVSCYTCHRGQTQPATSAPSTSAQ